MHDLFTNREIAAALTTVLFFVTITILAAKKSNIASSFKEVLRTLCHRKILIPLLLFIAFVGSAILLAYKARLWNQSLWKPTVIWVLITGVGLYFKIAQALEKPTFFRDTLKHTVKISIVVQFIANFESFPLWIEIPTQILAALLGLLSAAPRNEPRYAPIWKIANGYFLLLGVSAIVWTVWSTEWSQVDYVNFLLELVLPVWLTIVSVLYLYPLALFATHETTFVQMSIFSRRRHKHHKWRKLAAIVLRAGLSARNARTLGKYAGIIVEADGFRSAWREAARSIREEQKRIDAEEAAKRRLIDNAGMIGTDQDGKQLDQREHAETAKALYWLATCQMGHYRNLKRYRKDRVFFAIVEHTAQQHGLPTPTDIRLRVSADAQSWYAERKTIPGHWFAIGAAGPPPDQWLYDGATKPVKYPNAREWDQWVSGDRSVNWDGR